MASRDARQYQAERVAYLDSTLNQFGFNADGSMNRLGTRLNSRLGEENAIMGNVYQQDFASPKDSWNFNNTLTMADIAANNDLVKQQRAAYFNQLLQDAKNQYDWNKTQFTEGNKIGIENMKEQGRNDRNVADNQTRIDIANATNALKKMELEIQRSGNSTEAYNRLKDWHKRIGEDLKTARENGASAEEMAKLKAMYNKVGRHLDLEQNPENQAKLDKKYNLEGNNLEKDFSTIKELMNDNIPSEVIEAVMIQSGYQPDIAKRIARMQDLIARKNMSYEEFYKVLRESLNNGAR